jgi:hypothetical protein
MLLLCHKNAGQTHDIKITDRLEMGHSLKVWETVTTQNLIQEETKRRLNS